MTEAAMLVAMGFCAATLVALALMPLVADRARRKVERDLRGTAPGDPRQVAAERDGLRALAAVEQRRAEQKLEQATAARADAEAALGRREARIVALEQSGRADRARWDADLAQTRDAIATIEARAAGAEQARAEALDRAAEAAADREAMVAERDAATVRTGATGQAMDRLDAHARLLEAQLADRDASLERERRELGRLRVALAEAGRERELARNELLLATTQRTMLEGDVRDATRRADDLRLRLAAAGHDLETAERRLVDERAEKRSAEAALAELRHRFQRLEAQLVAAGRAGPDMLAEAELDGLRASLAAAGDEALARLAPPRAPRSAPATAAGPADGG